MLLLRCHLCGEIYLFTMDNVKHHVKRHKMTVGSYKSRYFGKNNTTVDHVDTSSTPTDYLGKSGDSNRVSDVMESVGDGVRSERDNESGISASSLESDADAAMENGDSQKPVASSSKENGSSFCQICCRSMRSIEAHVVKCHQVSLELYRTLFPDVSNQENCSLKTLEAVVPKHNNIPLDSSKGQGEPDISRVVKSEDNDILVTENWDETCRYICGICHRTVTNLRAHLKKYHGLSTKEYNELHPNIQNERVTHHR
jgi:hypothetical protein